MCKYCRTEELNRGEFYNGDSSILRIKDGSQLMEVNFNRYKTDTEKLIVLALDHAVCIDGQIFPIKTKEIPIKYCPFCGEEL